RVVVRSDAVVTPAVRDLLYQATIALAREDTAAGGFVAGLLLGVADTPFEPAALVRMLVQQGLSAQQLARCGLLSAVDELVDAVVRGGQLGVLLTHETAAALCLANRARGV